MSEKFRNIIRPAFMRNFTKNTLERYILIDIETMTHEEKDKFVSNVNERLWNAIQEVNIISKFNLPFVILRRVENDDDEKLRVVLTPDDKEYHKGTTQYVDVNNSHIIHMRQLSPQRIIQLGNMKGAGRAEILSDETNQIDAVVDIFLDISMFNSISYLKDYKNDQRQQFNNLKYKYFTDHKLNSYFYINPNDPPTYISFAFAHHITHNNLDYYGYALCWEDFLNEYFSKEKNVNPTPEKQLEHHIDYNNIDNQYKCSEFWKDYDPGSYLLLRINKKPNTEDREKRIINYFGQPKYHVGIIKVVPCQQYFVPHLFRDLYELNISAFKIVID